MFFLSNPERFQISKLRNQLGDLTLFGRRDLIKGDITFSYKKFLLFWGYGKTHVKNIARFAIVRPMKEDIERKVGYSFQNPHLLELAFTHRSYWNENKESCKGHNERLEFLGDSVLGMLVAEYLYKTLPEADEGSCSKLRSQIVAADACAAYIQKLGVESYLRLGRGEQLNGGKGRESIFADLFEALLGAIYLDSNYESVKKIFLSHFLADITDRIEMPSRNWKAELQDYTQKEFQKTPVYTVLEESGPSHEKLFVVAVFIDEKCLGEGRGASKKEAQVEAARMAIQEINR